MQNLQTFNFKSNSVRIELKNNEPLFCLKDVADILNISNAKVSRFNLSEKGVHKMYTLTTGGKQELTFINEPNLYRVIFRSNKKEAVEFQNWVFDEVLPSIRKTGSYSLTINTQQQHTIKEAVHQNVSRTGRTFKAVYHDLYNRFQIPKYQDLLAKDFDAAIEYLGCSDKSAIPLFSNMTTNGRWLVVVNNNVVTSVKSLANYSCVNVEAFKKLILQTKQQSEYLLELAKRLRIVEGECSASRLDTSIEELHPRFII